jgi:hypothetical protein
MNALKLPHCEQVEPIQCPMCGACAVLPLDAETRAAQPDDTTHVCHPMLEGCNHGFALEVRVYFHRGIA